MRVTICSSCYSFKTACIIIAIYYVIIFLLLVVYLYETPVVDEKDVTENYGVKPEDPIIRGMLWTFFPITNFYAIVSLALLVGAMKEIRAFVLIRIIFDIVFLAARVSVMSLVLYLDPRKFMALTGKSIFVLIIGLYFLIVVKSFYSDLKERQNNDAESV